MVENCIGFMPLRNRETMKYSGSIHRNSSITFTQIKCHSNFPSSGKMFSFQSKVEDIFPHVNDHCDQSFHQETCIIINHPLRDIAVNQINPFEPRTSLQCKKLMISDDVIYKFLNRFTLFLNCGSREMTLNIISQRDDLKGCASNK